MGESGMTREELKEKAHSLPLAPGVYLMQDKRGEIIYVGKAKKLKNRVSQYFADLQSHTPKTRAMVAQIDHFDVIVAASEFEALILECSLIKRHMPRYNILLKDDKGFPYLRLDMREPYPKLTLENTVKDDGAAYFGPFGSRSASQELINTIRLTFQLPGCSKQFPRDVGKDRTCLNYHLGACAGWCQTDKTQDEYRQVISEMEMLLRGNYQQLSSKIEAQMQQASENLEFERAAVLRDRLRSVENLGQRQLVTAGSRADTDAFGFYQTEAKACFAVLHYSGGNLIDKDYELLPVSDSPEEALSSLVKQYYLGRRAAPGLILLPYEMEDAADFSRLLAQELQKRVRIVTPKRGDQAKKVDLAMNNAREEARRVTTTEERIAGTLVLLQNMLGLPNPPRRIEAYDISNLGNDNIVASMTVFSEGKPLKRDYRHFKLEDMTAPDDYASMRQVLRRRFTHFLAGDKGFDSKPDLLLIDGGEQHVRAAVEELDLMGVCIPAFGMVKDARHRTRALVTKEGEEIGISVNQAVFSFVGRVQEETHRFAISFNRSLGRKGMRKSALDGISGIGEKRKQILLKSFGSVRAIREADLDALERLLPKPAARAVYDYFHSSKETGTVVPQKGESE